MKTPRFLFTMIRREENTTSVIVEDVYTDGGKQRRQERQVSGVFLASLEMHLISL